MVTTFVGEGQAIPIDSVYVWQCCDLETMVSRLECTRVHFVQVSVLVSRPEVQRS